MVPYPFAGVEVFSEIIASHIMPIIVNSIVNSNLQDDLYKGHNAWVD